MSPDRKTLTAWMHHLGDETDAAYLYRILASSEKNPQRSDIYLRIAHVEDRHVGLWRDLLAQHGHQLEAPKPSVRARFLAWLARRFGPSILLSLLLREEGQEVRGYIALHRESKPGATKETALTLAKESAEHADTLRDLAGATGEPWHRAKTGGFLRNIIYGFNDGLTANFGLVAGIIGAQVESQIVLVAGVAGMIADALSMGASGYLASKSEQEVYDHEIATEREEIKLMPELEQEELALLYEAKGISRERAQNMASDIMQDPEKALQEKVRDELGIGTAHATPFQEGWITGTATAVGALIPVAPFLLFDSATAIWTSFTVAMICHFAVGSARSAFTGRSIVRSGLDMFAVGLGVAIVGYVTGDLISQALS